MWAYLVVFLSTLVVDLIPFVAPPAWMLMVFLLVQFDLNPWVVLVCGVAGSTLGRFLFSLFIPRFSARFLKRRKNDDLKFLGRKLTRKLWQSWLFVLAYTLTPLSTTPLFTAAGMAKVKPWKLIPPFFVGKFISDAVLLFTGRNAVTSLKDLLRGIVSLKAIVTMIVGLVIVGGLLFIDWRSLLQRRRLKFKFKIWK